MLFRSDALADEVIQALEYTFFAFLIPPVIQAAKFMKTNLPSFAIGGAVASGIEGKDPNEEPTQEFNLGTELEKKKSNLDLNEDQSAVPGTVNQYGFEKTSNLFKAGFNAITKSSTKPTPVFTSAVKKAVENIAEKGTGDQILGTIRNLPNVKANEIKWIGLDEFLEGKKSVTKKQVIDFVNQNNIDITEVKQGANIKTAKLSDDVEFKKNKFEQKVLADVYKKDPEMRGEVPEELLEEINYDNFTPIAMKSENVIDKVMPMDFNTMRTLLGENPNIKDFRVLPNGNLRFLKEAESIKPSHFEITPFDFEKYQVEEAVRKFRQNDVKAPKFEEQTEPGGENYTELVFKIKKGGMDVGIPTSVSYEKLRPSGYTGKVGTVTQKGYTPFKSPNHMNIKSEIAHVRFKTRDLDGLKVLTVEEMQSDFAILAKKSFRRTGLNEGSQPKKTDFPFKNTWYELTTKRLIRYAADNGFDAIAIPKGIVPAVRYGEDIDKVKKLIIQKYTVKLDEMFGKQQEVTEYAVRYFDEKGMDVAEKVFTKNTLKDLEKEIGVKKFNELLELEKTNKLQLDTGDSAELLLDKEIILGSGKGKAELYDKAIPSFLKKYSKKWNAKVYDDKFETGDFRNAPDIPVTVLEITPSMKKSVQEEGQSLFEILGIGTGAAIAAESISDSQGNNTISNLTQ